MKVRLGYEIDPMEEGYKLYQLLNSTAMASVLKDFDDELRSLHKYQDEQWAWDLRQKLNDMCIDEGFTIDELWR